jgi:hypothetical protein
MHSDPSNVKKPLAHASGFTSSHGQQQAINFVNRKLSLSDRFHEQNFFFLLPSKMANESKNIRETSRMIRRFQQWQTK